MVLARYGSGVASVGMMLVAARYGRQGLGRRLMGHLLDQAGDATVFLTATSYGRPLYDKLGFRSVGRSATFLGRFQFREPPAGSADRTRPARDDDLPALSSGQIVGYAGVWPNDGTDVIGPVVAPDTESAQVLIISIARNATAPVRLDLDPDRTRIPPGPWPTACPSSAKPRSWSTAPPGHPPVTVTTFSVPSPSPSAEVLRRPGATS